MAPPPLFILLCSGEHEKLQMAAMLASVAAASERAVQLFLSMNAVLAFDKDASLDERYRGGHFSQRMQEGGAPDAIDLIMQGKMIGDLKVLVCSMALAINGWEEDQLIEGVVDEEIGLTKFLSDAEDGQLITL